MSDGVVPAIEVSDLGMVYPGGVRALKGVSFQVEKGEFLAVLGLSGSGKSTLLRCVNRLLDPTEGSVHIFGEEVTALRGSNLRKLRCRVAMIFQQFNLVKRQTVMTNVLSGALGRSRLLPSLLLTFPQAERARAQAYLERVGLPDRGDSRADALSGGQQQRVAIARALMQEPQLFLADEPVASLDPALRHSIMRHIEILNREEGLTVLCSLHDIDLVTRYATRLIALRDGELVWQGLPENFDQGIFKEIYGQEAEPASNSGY
ncbi:MAG: phosphonate ABC transporter ATP-binding protein [Thermoanaerobaculales bacterium]|nr:phosphonate ABC transporter ATP-binding protein [Thermoanaerobaculales bacterium]